MGGSVEGPAKVYLVVNPVGGSYDGAAMEQALETCFGERGWEHEVYETTGEEDVSDLVRRAVQRGFDTVVAAGGDGTVSAVAGGLIGSQSAMGIIPIGTGNALARELGIPISIDQACVLISGDHRLRELDVMEINGRFYILNVSVGLSALAMKDTPSESKRRFGVVAYIWAGIKRLAGFHPRRFRVRVDELEASPRASDIVVTSGGMPVRPFLGVEEPRPLDDGQLGVYILRARTLFDYIALAVSLLLGKERQDPRVSVLSARERIEIDAAPSASVQADGEPIGQTPVTIRLLPQAVRVIAPPPKEQAAAARSEAAAPAAAGPS